MWGTVKVPLRRPRRLYGYTTCFESALFVAVLLLSGDNTGCDGYMSTIHLGRTLKAFRTLEEHDQEARLQQQQQLLQQQQLQQQQQQQNYLDGSYPTSDSTKENVDQAGLAVPRITHDGGSTAAAHPSWAVDSNSGDASSSSPVSPVASEALVESSMVNTTMMTTAHPSWAVDGTGVPPSTSSPAEMEAGADGDDVDGETVKTTADGVAIAGVRIRSSSSSIRGPGLHEQFQEAEGEVVVAQEESVTAVPQPATMSTSAASRTGRKKKKIIRRRRVKKRLTAKTVVRVGTASGFAEDDVALIPAAENDLTSRAGARSSRRVSGHLDDDFVPLANASGEVFTDSTRQDHAEDHVEDPFTEEDEEAETKEVRAEAIRELVHIRDTQDKAVQAAAALTVEALPVTQRECFEDVKAFTFGGEDHDSRQVQEGERLSEEEARALDTVAICGDKDGVVLAFLRHSKFDVRKAKESMRRCCAWRRETKADELFSRAVASVKVHKHRIYWPSGFHKVDRAGRPVFYDRVGQSDLSALRADPDGLDQDEMVRIFIQNMEVRRRFVLTRLSREAGHPVDQMTTVLDLTGLGVRHMSKEALAYTRRISDIFQDNYSGMSCSLLVVNAPWIFSKGWQVIEGFLSEDTAAKVKVLGKGQAGLRELEKYVPRENIPDFLGGESPATLGPNDPLWSEVDAAIQSWGQGEDPFLIESDIRETSDRMKRERRAERKARLMRDASSARVSARAKPGQGKAGALHVEADDVADEAGQQGSMEELGEKKKPKRARARRASARAAIGKNALDGLEAVRRRRKGGVKALTLKGKGEKALDEMGDKKNPKKSRAKFSAQGLTPNRSRRKVGSGSSESISSLDIGVSKGVERSDQGIANDGEQLKSVLKGKDGATNEEQVDDSRATRVRRVKRVVTWQDEIDRVKRKEEDDRRKKEAEQNKSLEEVDADTNQKDTNRKGVNEGGYEEDGRGKTFGWSVLEGFVRGFVPDLKAMVDQIVGAMLAACKVLTGAVESVFVFLRDLFFEQVEIAEQE